MTFEVTYVRAVQQYAIVTVEAGDEVEAEAAALPPGDGWCDRDVIEGPSVEDVSEA